MLSTFVVAQQKPLDTLPKRIYTTNKISSEIAIDGLINEDAWNKVGWEDNFTQWQPDEGKKPTQQTKFKVVYDEKFLYVAILALDNDPSKIDKRMSRRDGFAGDWVEINIDSYHDLRTAFSFTISASGVKGDQLVSENGANWDASWNPIWYVSTSINDEGWVAEFKIPFTQLRFSEKDEQIWGFQVQRRDFRLEEFSLWQRIPREAAGWVSNLGELHGLKNIKPQKQIEIQPYVLGQLDTYEKQTGNPYATGNEKHQQIGLDGKIGITNNLTLDFTVNPDFGQVEADPAAIALDGFQIFFREQRPFFVENKNIFDFSFSNSADNLFYSRRIGRSPQGYPNAPGNAFVDMPVNTTILGAAKFSGKTDKGWSVGLLESVTDNMYAEIDIDGEKSKQIVEPLTNYLVARVQKDFNENNSFLGAIFTATNRNLDSNLQFLTKAAYTGGIDFRHAWKNRNYYAKGKFLASNIHGSAESIQVMQESITHLFQRVDAGHVNVDPTKTSLTGTGGEFEIGKEGGGNWRYSGGFIWRSPELELNDIGFLRQADEIRQTSSLGYLFLKPTKTYRMAQLYFNQFSTYDFEGNYNRIQYDLQGNIVWDNNWWSEAGFGHKPRIFINTFLRGGPRWRFSDENYWFLFIGSDQRKKFNFTLGYVNSRAQQNNFGLDRFVFRFNYQPMDALSISFSTEYEENPNKTQYVTEQNFGETPRYIMGNIEQDTWSASIRLNYNINPNLTLQYYGQPFISRGRYSDFNFVLNSIASKLTDRVVLYNNQQISKQGDYYLIDENLNQQTDYSFYNPDFAFVQFRSNLVMRWEYIPGSEIYLVWSQGITSFGDSTDTLERSLQNEILGKKPSNTFLIKATYRFLL